MLILLRHGQTPNNAQARLQGLVDASLTDLGVAQAKQAGEYIRNRWDVSSVVTSSLIRSHETAEHAGFGDYETAVDERWSEIDFGNYDERKIGEVIVELTARWRSDVDFAPEGGESLAGMHDRVVEACTELAPRAADENVLVVTHATPIKSAAVWALGGPASMILNLWVNLSTVSVLNQVHGEFILAEYNRHLDDV